MDPAKRKEIASKGGRAAHAKGTGYEFTSDEARIAGKLSHAKTRLAAANVIASESSDSDVTTERQTAPHNSNFLGNSEAARAVRQRLELIAHTDKHILITGETGTGKTMVAELIHKLSRRHSRAFCSINCAAVSETLIESELFGHKRGAFTNAFDNRLGYFLIADRGTLFLDEVGEASPGLQAKLLRAIDSGRFNPVGSDRELTSDVRVLASTNVDLADALRSHKFRRDLYYRLFGLSLHMPPLRERMEDLPLLVEYCVNERARSFCDPVPFDGDAMQILTKHVWPGNVRELFAVVESALLLANAVGASSVSAKHIEFPLW